MKDENNKLWLEKYSVKNDFMDEEHKQLLSLIDRMGDVVENNSDNDKMTFLLFEMTEYAIKHFRNEENYLESIGYPKLDEHKELHRRYSNKVLEFTTNYLTEDENRPKEVLGFLRAWWTDHIITEDQEYAAFLPIRRNHKVFLTPV